MKAVIFSLIITLLMGGVGMCIEQEPTISATGDIPQLWDSGDIIDFDDYYAADNVLFSTPDGDKEFLSISRDGIWTFYFDDGTELTLTREQVRGVMSLMKRASISLRISNMGWGGVGLYQYINDLELLP